MSTAYKPRADSLASQCISFFRRHPTKALTLEEITEKFDATRGNIHTLLGPGVLANVFKRTLNEDDEYCYSAGPALASVAAKPDRRLRHPVASVATKPRRPAAASVAAIERALPAPALADAPRKVRGPVKGFASPRYTLDISKLQVEEGVPFMKINGPTVGKWEPIFQKLEKPDQSIALPGHLRGALASAVRTRNKQNKGMFRVAMTGPGQARIWRLA